MAEEKKNGAAQEEMGELFVNIGATGLGSLIKGLNAASASFLLTKNAAEQFTKPFRSIVNQSMNASVSLGKMQSQIGGSFEQLQQLTTFFKSKNLSEGLFNDIERLQQVFINFAKGGGLPENMARAFNLLNIDWTNYSGELTSVLDLIQNINEKTKNLPKEVRLSHLADFGMSGEWGYAFDRPDFNISSELVLNNNEIKNIIEANEALKEFNVQIQQLGQILSSKILPAITPFIKGLNKFIGNKETRENFFNSKDLIYNLFPLTSLYNTGAKLYKLGNEEKIKTLDGEAGSLPPLPSNINSISRGDNNLTITNNNYISSDSPSAVAREIKQIDFEQIQRNQYELENMPGR